LRVKLQSLALNPACRCPPWCPRSCRQWRGGREGGWQPRSGPVPPPAPHAPRTCCLSSCLSLSVHMAPTSPAQPRSDTQRSPSPVRPQVKSMSCGRQPGAAAAVVRFRKDQSHTHHDHTPTCCSGGCPTQGGPGCCCCCCGSIPQGPITHTPRPHTHLLLRRLPHPGWAWLLLLLLLPAPSSASTSRPPVYTRCIALASSCSSCVGGERREAGLGSVHASDEGGGG